MYVRCFLSSHKKSSGEIGLMYRGCLEYIFVFIIALCQKMSSKGNKYKKLLDGKIGEFYNLLSSHLAFLYLCPILFCKLGFIYNEAS